MAASAHGCSVSTVLPFKNVRSWTNRISARHTTFYLDSNTPLSFVELCMQLLHPHCPRPMSKLCMIPMVMFQPKLKCSRDSPPAVSLSAQETWRAWCETGRNVLVQSQKKSGKRNYGAVFTQVWKGLRVIEWWWTESKKAKDIKREREGIHIEYPNPNPQQLIQDLKLFIIPLPFQNSTSFARVHRNRSRSLQRTSDQQICTSKRFHQTWLNYLKKERLLKYKIWIHFRTVIIMLNTRMWRKENIGNLSLAHPA